MPISRYEIRNEYSLADPELYRAADKDDPEALLEGVAMAGLVGLLRQLGDLAEFAADIFHNLHEDVMATAARGHTLAVRVQQLETELPSLERAFLSQTDHSSFFYHPGVDWHPNPRLDKNLVTQGDLPRFIMDSYEECREPPRLFLLDKFDVAGAGACQKRYTDPSFFKVETSEMTSADQREKKIRKAKKKGPRWRNREAPEVLPTSHTKLHQLFLEERVENGVSAPSRRAKLKRRLNGFPFNSKTGESYMEKILKSPSPDHEVLHDMTVDSPQLKWATNDHEESCSDIFEFRPVNSDRERGGRKRSTPSSPDREGFALNPPMYDSDESESPIDDKIFEVPSSHPSIATDGISATLDKVIGEKVVSVDAESKREGSLTGYESDDMVSEIDNYVDAPSTMESEMDRASDLRMKSDDSSLIKTESLIRDTYEDPFRSRSSDSQSTEDSTMSDVGNNLSTKEISSFSSDSPSISAEKPQSESFSTKGFQCTDIRVNEIVDASFYEETADDLSKPVVSDDTYTEIDAITNRRSESEQVSSWLCSDGSVPPLMHSDLDEVVRNFTKSDEKLSTLDDEEENTDPVIGPPHVASDGTCTETNAITNHGSEFKQMTYALCINGSIPTLELSDPEEVVEDQKLEAPRSDEMVSTDDKENKINLVIDPPFSSSACISGLQSENDLSRSSDGEQLVDGPNSDVLHHTTDRPVKTSSRLLHEDESDGEDRASTDDAASILNIPSVLSTNGTLDTMSSENVIPGKFEDEVPENLFDALDDEGSNVSTDSPNHFPCIMEASLRKGLEETSLASARTLNVEVNHSNSSIDSHISLENLKLSHLANSPDRPMEGFDAHEEDVIPEEETTLNEPLPFGTPEPCDDVGLMGTEIAYHVSPSDSEVLERSHCTSEDLEEPAGTSETVEIDEVSLRSDSNAQEVTEITRSTHPKTENEIHVVLNKTGLETDEFNTTDFASPVPAVSDDASLSKLADEHDECFVDTGIDELENDKNCLSEEESDLVEKVGPTEASASGVGTIGCTTVDDDQPKSKLSGLVPNSHSNLEFDHSLEVIHAATTQSPVEQCGLDGEQELINKSGLETDVHDSQLLPVDYDTEESVQDQIGLPPSHLDQHLLHPIEMNPELSPLSPINHLQILDDDHDKGDSNFVSAFSLGNGPSPPSISEFSRLSNSEINVPGYPKDPFGSFFPPSNPFLEANQTSLSDSPPLPPLPPVQWRMGKLQHALPSAKEEMIRDEESFPQSIFPSPATDDVDSTLSAKSTHDGSSPATASTDNIHSSCEEMKDSLTELAAETISKEEHLDNSSSSLEDKTLHEITDNPPKIENKPQPLTTPISESVSTSSAAEDGSANGSQKVTSKPLHETTDNPPKIENKPQPLATPISESVSTSSAAEDGSANGSQKVTSKPLHETTDNPPKIENKPQLSATPISESVSTSSAAEDGSANGSQKVKWSSWPRNPLVDDVSFLDKSKLRKVTERIRPEPQKVDERDSLLEQIRTKSFNLKPAMASRPSIRDRGPNTNLQVVAILEKANAIRQAFAGSDEDDDSWSE